MFGISSKRLTKQLGAKGKPKPRKTNSYRPCLDCLEERVLMAGNVTAVWTLGELYLSEESGQASLNNAVLIRQLGNGKLRIEGAVTADGTKSLINGAPFRDFPAPTSLFVNFGGGKDSVSFSPASTDGTPVFGKVSIDVGSASAVGDADQDFVFLANLYADSLAIFTGASNDSVFVSPGTTIANGLSIRTGAGADGVSIRDGTSIGNIDIQTYDALAENDKDLVFFEKKFGSSISVGAMSVRLGAGSDQFIVSDGGPGTFVLQVDGSMLLDTGAGADKVLVVGFNVGGASGESMTILTGSGRDSIDINGGLVSGNLDIQTQGDADQVHLASVDVLKDLLVKLGGGDDQVHVELTNVGQGNDHLGNLVVQTGAGADEVTLDLRAQTVFGNVEIQTYASLAETDADQVHILAGIVNGNIFTGLGGTVLARLGGGNDFFELIDALSYGDLDLDMGAGNDIATLSGNIYDHVIARMGEGNDLLTLGDIWGAYRLIAHGDGGFDQLVGTANIHAQNRDLIGWEVRDDQAYQ